MSNTTLNYLSIQNNLSRYQKLEANKPEVKTATAYYKANIGKVKTVDQFLGNYRLLSYALQAYGLGDQINNKALIKKVLQQGATSPRALANTLPNPAWKAFAKAYDFTATGNAAPTSAASLATTTADYTEQQLEADQGQQDVGVELALYFKRVAPNLSNSYGVLADKNLLQVVETIFNLPTTASAAQIDKEAKQLSKLVPLKDLQDPAKLDKLVTRFTAAYQANYGPNSTATPLTVSNGNVKTTVGAASSILSGIASNNSTVLASTLGYSPFSSSSLLSGLKLGG